MGSSGTPGERRGASDQLSRKSWVDVSVRVLVSSVAGGCVGSGEVKSDLEGPKRGQSRPGV